MFSADFLANVLVFRALDQVGARILIITLCAIAFAAVCATVGEFRPLVALLFVGFLIFLAIRRIFRAQPTLEPLQGRTEPRLYPLAQPPQAGLRASGARWPVSRH
jgi:hypothetical protein